MNVAERMQALDVLNHLDAELKNIDLLKVLLVIVEDRTHSFPKFVLHKEFRLIINLIYLVSFLE